MFENFRRYQRYSISAGAVIRRQDAGSPERLTAQVTTISQGGMGFYTDVPMEKATPVSIELLFHPFGAAAGNDVLQGRIASVCSQGNDYYVGIAFDREISYDRFVEIIG
ncbi:MAG: PilZ domain-containing protein [Nitrospirae bacterium]|nr:PilZ domain-containing protein [Nitrospirota bacterium]